MDPQSQSFTPYTSTTSNNSYPNSSYPDRSNGNNESLHLQAGLRLQSDVARLQPIQLEHAEILAEHSDRIADHTERLARIERRQEEDARLRSVWGHSSPFPSVLSGTPQQAPQQYPPIEPSADQYRGLADDETNHMMSSLHLDPEEEPRSRALGANSRANSVRFDETANQNHFSHSSRPSLDLTSRQSSGYSGGLHMGERTGSHKSEGRASSVHSMRSLVSGRASSLNLEYGAGDSSSSDTFNLAPGVMILGAVPAIIRCWMNTNFKHHDLLYAAVCTGSYKSLLGLQLIQKLGFEWKIHTPEDGGPRTIALDVYFPEAVPHPTAARSSSPAAQLPSLTIDFLVIEHPDSEHVGQAIQIFIGSDVLVAHSGDVMFSSNTLSLYDKQRNKLSIPLVRPENEAAFNGLYITSGEPQSVSEINKAVEEPPKSTQIYLNGLGQGSSVASPSPPPVPGKYRPPGVLAASFGSAESSLRLGGLGSEIQARSSSQQSTSPKPSLLLNTRNDQSSVANQSEEPSMANEDLKPMNDSRAQTTPQRSDQLMGSWRRDGTHSSTTPSASVLDWSSAINRQEAPFPYQPKPSGMKVLKPKLTTRVSTVTPSSAGTSSPASEGRSKFFDQGRFYGRDNEAGKPKAADAPPPTTTPKPKENQAPTTTPKAKVNPIGGASAFVWLKK